MVIGGVIGELLDIDRRLQTLGDFLQRKLAPKNDSRSIFSSISVGFVNCSLVVCIGSMAIVGAIQSGMSCNHETLYAKALIDGVIALVMASTMGIGVSLSGVAVGIYESVIAIFASFLAAYLPTAVITEMTCVGSLLIIALFDQFLILTRRKAEILPKVPDTLGLVIIAKSGCPVRSLLIEAIV